MARIVEFPITFRERTVGESKLSNGIVNEAFVLVLRLWLQRPRAAAANAAATAG